MHEGSKDRWFKTGQVRVSKACWLYAAVNEPSYGQSYLWQKEGWEILDETVRCKVSSRGRSRSDSKQSPVVDYSLMRKCIAAGPVDFDTDAEKTEDVIWIFKELAVGEAAKPIRRKEEEPPRRKFPEPERGEWQKQAGYNPLEIVRRQTIDPGRKTAYVIITTSAIKAACRELDKFVAHKRSMGFNAMVVTEKDFGGGTGIKAAENIRSWLKSHYIRYNIEYVLLIGDLRFNSPVPMMMIWGKDDTTPTDYFYADLTSEWDWDGDGKYGEMPDDFGPDGVDWHCDVFVGRIPYYGNINELDSILRKTMNYEKQDAKDTGWRKNVLIAVPGKEAAPEFPEDLKDNILTPAGWSFHRIYDKDYGLKPAPETIPCKYETVAKVWRGNKFGLVLMWSHGYHHSASGVIKSEHTSQLNDKYPAFVVQLACDSGHPEATDNLAYSLLKNGAVCTIAGTRGFSKCTWLGRDYISRLVKLGLSCGRAFYETKSWQHGVGRHTLLTFNLLGDPSLKIIPQQDLSRRRFVSCKAERGGDGKSWETAYKDLQDALDEIISPGIVNEIWVAAGTYKPDRGSGKREATFRLDKGIAIYGGFTGNETQLDQRSPIKNLTVLSGDIGIEGNSSDNSYHVITFKDTWEAAVIDGFIITGGNASGRKEKHNSGGGIYNHLSSPRLYNCIFRENSAADKGGAIYSCGEWNTVSLTNCLISNNNANKGGGLFFDCRARIVNCTLTANSAKHGGGIYQNKDGLSILAGCTLWANKAEDGSGEIYNTDGCSLIAGYCNIEGGINGPKCRGAHSDDGGYNINTEPSFVKSKEPDYQSSAEQTK
jgi:predicted outer membrane repeat protein